MIIVPVGSSIIITLFNMMAGMAILVLEENLKTSWSTESSQRELDTRPDVDFEPLKSTVSENTSSNKATLLPTRWHLLQQSYTS